MTMYGYKLAAESFDPNELVRQARLAEAAGFEFVEMSDHFHPWLDVQGHSPFTWTVFGAIAGVTDKIGLVTGVTCPTVRYHPAIIAQAAATLALVSHGRFALGVGAGERLNEHVVGRGFPSASERQDMLREAVQIIKLLWSGGYQSYRGEYFDVEDARIFDLPDELPTIAVAAGGPQAAKLAAEVGDGLFGTDPLPELIETYRSAGGTGPKFGEAAIAWDLDEQSAVSAAHRIARWSLLGWKVMSELPNPVNFEEASEFIREADIREQLSCGPELAQHVQSIRAYEDTGYDRVVIMNLGENVDGFMEFAANDLLPALRA